MKETLDAGWEAWLTHVGALNYGRWVKLLGDYLKRRPTTPHDLAGAVQVFAATRRASSLRDQQYMTVARFAEHVQAYLDLARQPLVDDAGALTPKGELLTRP